MDSAFDYIVKYNINSQDNYPYVARDQACKKKGGEFSITGYVDVEGCTELANALAQRPISVAVDASVWSSYRSGILKGCQKNINHGVLLVGVTADFWRIKNSWGVGWGESGFIRLSPGDTCALCQYPSYPTVA
jgi:cathepsin L